MNQSQTHGHGHNHDNGHNHDHDHNPHGGPHHVGVGPAPAPVTFSIPPHFHAIVTVSFYGALHKQIIVTEQSGFSRVYDSCIDGRRPYIVLRNLSDSDTAYYTVKPLCYSTPCIMPEVSQLDLICETTANNMSSGNVAQVMYTCYQAATTIAATTEKIGVVTLIQGDLGDLET